jgi:hypothetical protein
MVSEPARRAAGTVLAALAAALLVPAAALASGPGVDEYTLNIPGAGGNHPSGGGPPTADPGSLPPRVQAQLTGPQGRLLATVATAPQLGAPRSPASDHAGSPNSSGSGGGGQASGAAPHPDSSVPGAALRTAGDGTTLLLIAGAILVALAASGTLLRRRGAAA